MRWAQSSADEQLVAALLVQCSLDPVELVATDVVMMFSDDGTLVACGGLHRRDDCGWVRSVAVRQDRRRTGLARRIVEALIGRARQYGVGQLWLMTETAEDFFLAQGFAVRARGEEPEAVRGFSQWTSCPGTAVLMSAIV